MTNNAWNEVADAYAKAAQLPDEARTLFLNETYPNRPDIRQEVQSLLECQAEAESLTQSAILTAAANMLASDDDDLIGMVLAQKYIVRQLLGGGNMGEVYLADHVFLEMPFALKRPASRFRGDAEWRQRLLDEARRAVILKHDNVARVYDVIESGEDMFIVMEYIEGESLRSRLKAQGRPFSAAEFLPIAIQCASALAAAHDRRIIHLDVKPENIMLGAHDQVKICDFGVAKKMSADAADSAKSSEWTFAGTPAYMAPEVILSYQFDERADQFSLGIVFYELLTGQNPFLGDDSVPPTARIVKETPPPLRKVNPDIDPALERIIARLLSKEPEQRYPTTNELVDELQALRRSQDRVRDIIDSVREGFAQTLWMKLAAPVFVLLLLALPLSFVYRTDIERRLGISPLPQKKIVAVLPFRAIGDNRGERFYSDGVAEILTGRLAQLTTTIPNLQVIPASEIYARKVDTAEKARNEFGATIVMAGTFQFVGNQVQVSYSLIDPVGHRDLRAGSKQATAADPFSLQDAVIRDVTRLLELQLSPPAPQNMQVFGTTNPEAYFLYTEGLGALRNFQERENIDTAVNLLRQATDRDPTYAAAHAALGQSYWRMFTISKEPGWLAQAQVACEQATSLNQRLSQAHTCLGLVNQSRGDYELAAEDFGRAIAFDSSNDEAERGLGATLEAWGRLDEAEKAYLKAVEVRRQYWAGYMRLGAFYANRRHDYAKAIDNFYKALAASPGNGQAYYALGGAYNEDGQYEKAISTLEQAVQLRPYFETYNNLGLAYLKARRFAEALKPLERASAMSNDYRPTGTLARAYWLAGQIDKARETYQLAITQGEKLLQVNPRDADVHILVGRYYAMLGKQPEAISHLTLALNTNPNDPHYLLIAAVAYLRLGNRTTPLNLMEQASAHGAKLRDVRAEPELDELASDPRYIALASNNAQQN
jgi:serine/threonine-protein kinase